MAAEALSDEVEELEQDEAEGGGGGGGGAVRLYRLKCCLTRVAVMLTR